VESDEKATIKMIIDSALHVVKNYISKEPDTIISVEGDDKEWTVVVEVLERKVVPDTQDILGRYEISLSLQGELLRWRQTMIRRRSDLIEQTEEE